MRKEGFLKAGIVAVVIAIWSTVAYAEKLTVRINNPFSSYQIGNKGKVILYDENWNLIASARTRSNKITFEVTPGNYKYEVYNDGPAGSEFWGSGEVGWWWWGDREETFTRKMPYVRKIEQSGSSGTSTFKVTVSNPSSGISNLSVQACVK